MSPMVDFTTMLGTKIPITVGRTYDDIGYETVMFVQRVGNLVIATGTFVLDASTNEADMVDTPGRIPYGFVPSSRGVGAIQLPFSGSQNNQSGGWTIETNGSIKFSLSTKLTAPQRFFYNGCWFTDDAWPN